MSRLQARGVFDARGFCLGTMAAAGNIDAVAARCPPGLSLSDSDPESGTHGRARRRVQLAVRLAAAEVATMVQDRLASIEDGVRALDDQNLGKRLEAIERQLGNIASKLQLFVPMIPVAIQQPSAMQANCAHQPPLAASVYPRTIQTADEADAGTGHHIARAEGNVVCVSWRRIGRHAPWASQNARLLQTSSTHVTLPHAKRLHQRAWTCRSCRRKQFAIWPV